MDRKENHPLCGPEGEHARQDRQGDPDPAEKGGLILVRDGRPEDHGAFHRLAPELSSRLVAACGFFTAEVHSTHEVAGFCAYRELPGSNTIDIVRLEVDDRYRRQGIGLALMTAVARRLTDERPMIKVVVNEMALDAQLFLRACGVTARIVIKHAAPEGRDAYLFAVHKGDLLDEG